MLFSDYNSYNKASAFYLLASSSLSESVKARIKITNWFNEYSDYSKMDFLQRFKSNDDMSFYSAFTELFTFQLFNSNGFEVKRGEAKMPDFSAEKDGFKILIECTLSEDSIMKSSAHKFLNSFSEKIDEIDSDY
ncbi:MAG TPA: hypothetical protein PKN99_07135, partial [Cyclobacteriaceae bacterium]|nr:hypothetical protein [Cyclobacteriaceae bacterium]